MSGFKIFSLKNTVFIFILALNIFGALPSLAEQKMKEAVFIRPDVEDRFWELTETVMQAACDDLNINLNVYHINDDPFDIALKAREISQSGTPPDIVIFEAHGRISLQVFEIFDKAGINMFTINTVITPEILKKIGEPRYKYKHWIGRISPDDTEAGFLIGELLYQNTKKLNPNTNSVGVAAIEGIARVAPSHERVEGLKKSVQSYSDYNLLNVSEGYWNSAPSQSIAELFLEQHEKDLNAIWAVNDKTAIGAVKAIENAGLIPGQDVLVAGIDWIPEIFDYVENGKVEGSLGGHFMEGAWAIIMTYDYMHDLDFAKDPGVSLTSHMRLIDQSNVGQYGDKLKNMDWSNIDFQSLSKTHNSNIEKYTFNIFDLLDQTD